MTEVTRCEGLTPVHNGRIGSQCATLHAEQGKLTHGLGKASVAERAMSSPTNLFLVHMRFLISGFLLGLDSI